MTLNEITKQLPPYCKLPTLGRGQKFIVENTDGVVTIINSQKNRKALDAPLLDAVFRRYESLAADRRLRTSEYTEPKFTEGDRIFSSYVARIIDHLTQEGRRLSGSGRVAVAAKAAN